MGMFLYVCLLTWLTGHWNRRKQRMELSLGINVLIMIVSVLWVVSFFLHVFGGVGGWVLYAVPVGMSLIVLLIAIISSVMGQLDR
jgi:cobalamin biosynthesis protein CobD/CbiB